MRVIQMKSPELGNCETTKKRSVPMRSPPSSHQWQSDDAAFGATAGGFGTRAWPSVVCNRGLPQVDAVC